MKSCADVRENISAYADGELSEAERTAFEEHISSCPECRMELDEMMQIIKLCSSMPLQQLPEGFRDELHEKLTAVAARNKNIRIIEKPKKKLHAKTLASIAAGILLVFVGGSIVRYGLLSEKFGSKSDYAESNYQLSANAPETASAADSYGKMNIIFGEAADGSGEMQAAASLDAPAEANQIIDDTGADQSLALQRSNDLNRSALTQKRSTGYNALAVTETASSKSSEITITADEPEAVAETVAELASLNNGIIPVENEPAGSSDIQSSSAWGREISDTDETRIQMQIVFTQDDYQAFTAAVNDAFGAANVQIGPFITEDMTDQLNALIEQSEMYDNNIKELQNKNSNNEKVEKLKKEKEEIVQQIETIRLNSDFVNVRVNINRK